MDRKTARVVGVILATLAFLLVLFATVIRYAHGKPTDYTALLGALFCVFFIIVIARPRGEK